MNPVIVIESSDDEKQLPIKRKNESEGEHGTELEKIEKTFEEFFLLCSTVIEQSQDSKGMKILEYLKKKHTTRSCEISRSYRKLLQWYNKRMKKGDDRIFVFIKDAVHALELNSSVTSNNSCVSKKRKLSQDSDDHTPSIPTQDAPIPKSENICVPSTSKSDATQLVSEEQKLKADQDVAHTSTSTPIETIASSPRKQTTNLRIKKLESYLKSLSKEIIRLQSAEISVADMGKKDSSYVQEGKLKDRFMKAYRRLCELRRCKVVTGRVMEKRINIKSSEYPVINRKIELFINNPKRKQDLPDSADIFRLVRKASTRNGLNLSEKLIQETARKIFTEVGQKMQKRRHRDFVYEFGCSAVDDENTEADPASSDVGLQEALDKNREVALSSLDVVYNKYATIDQETKEDTENGEHDISSQKSENDVAG